MIPPTLRSSPRWILLIETLLLIALCALLARWAATLLTGSPLPVPPTVSSPVPQNNTANGLMSTARLFGSYPAGTLSENVQVVGVIADTVHQTGNGSVLISVDGRPAKAYQIGDNVEGRRLAAIRSDAIEMEVNGVRQSYRLPVRPVQSTSGISISPGNTN